MLGCNGQSGKKQLVEAGRSFDFILSHCLVQQGPNTHRYLATLAFKIEGKIHIYTDISEGRMLHCIMVQNSYDPKGQILPKHFETKHYPYQTSLRKTLSDLLTVCFFKN